MTLSLADFVLILTLILAGTLATDIWRMAGVFLSRKVDLSDPVFLWVKDVSTALLAGLVSRIVFYPPAGLAEVPLEVRLAALIAGIAVYLLSGRNMLLSLVYGCGTLLTGQWLFGLS
jgi:branched-subunit amino acid transport protein